jgi:hypothetical protein
MVTSIVVGITTPSTVVDHIAVYCFVVLATITVLFQALFLRRRGLQNRAASGFLRIRINSRNFPPWNPLQYERWRAEHDLPRAR